MAVSNKDRNHGRHEPDGPHEESQSATPETPVHGHGGEVPRGVHHTSQREAGGNGAPKSADVLAAEEKIAHLEALTADLERRLKQALADQENSRKRSQRDAETAVKFAASGFAAGLLPTLDHLQLALNAVPGDEAAREPMKRLLEGVRATERALLSTMKKHGVKRIDSAGEPFDPNLHEAVAVIERDDLPAGTVADVLQPGYLHHDRLLRPAMVKVAKSSSKDAP